MRRYPPTRTGIEPDFRNAQTTTGPHGNSYDRIADDADECTIGNMTLTIRPWPISHSEVDLSWMVGRTLSAISCVDAGNWSFTFESGDYIGVECLWRIVGQNSIALTSEDDGQRFGLPEPIDAALRASELLIGATIRAVELHSMTLDILIAFEGDLRLEIIPTSSRYESWQLRDPFGSTFYAQGGGQICQWTQKV